MRFRNHQVRGESFPPGQRAPWWLDVAEGRRVVVISTLSRQQVNHEAAGNTFGYVEITTADQTHGHT